MLHLSLHLSLIKHGFSDCMIEQKTSPVTPTLDEWITENWKIHPWTAKLHVTCTAETPAFWVFFSEFSRSSRKERASWSSAREEKGSRFLPTTSAMLLEGMEEEMSWGEGLSPWRPACPVQSEEGVSAVVLTLLQQRCPGIFRLGYWAGTSSFLFF